MSSKGRGQGLPGAASDFAGTGYCKRRELAARTRLSVQVDVDVSQPDVAWAVEERELELILVSIELEHSSKMPARDERPHVRQAARCGSELHILRGLRKRAGELRTS